jgi:DNA mismatch repair ATPase MutS
MQGENKNNFLIPIHYTNTIKILPNVLSDLELVPREETPDESMYNYLLKPSNIFGKIQLKKWSKSFTNDLEYLENTQDVIKEYANIQSTSVDSTSVESTPDYENISSIWREIQEDKHFIERYNFMEWESLKSFNDSASFLQTISCIQVISPLLSLIAPILILFFPFLLLLWQGHEITFDTYIFLLKTIAKNHFIGKMLNLRNLDAQSIVYTIISVLFYFYSTYQNILSTVRFYTNIKKMNENLLTLKNYLAFTKVKMESFICMHREKPKYKDFCNVTNHHFSRISAFLEEFTFIQPFSHSLQTFTNIGEMLRLYYKFYEYKDIKESVEYFFGFTGYLDNLRGLSENLRDGNIAFAKFTTAKFTTEKFTTEKFTNKKTKIDNQYYPKFKGNKKVIKNNASLRKNIIITGPNASGKTTFMKTTALNIIFSQQFGCGFYSSAIIQPYTHIHSYLNIPDTSDRDSLFQAETRRCKDILEVIDQSSEESHHLCIFDELYSGTNYKDAVRTATAFLKYLSREKRVDFMLTTHYTQVCKNVKNEGKKDKNNPSNVAFVKMDVDVDETGEIHYNYKTASGISYVEGGSHILKNMNYPKEIIDSLVG